MKILFIAMSESVHVARWISQISDQGWSLHLFPSLDYAQTHPDFKNITVHHSFYGRQRKSKPSVKFGGIPVLSRKISTGLLILTKEITPRYRIKQLKRLITKLKPDIVHSMEIQSAGYLALEVKKMLGKKFPTWIVTNWGSDIYLFARLENHQSRIREVLKLCDFYSCECHRDIKIAKEYGLKGKILPVLPNSGGLDIQKILSIRKNSLTSERKTIMLKGYQGWSGRALVGLRALERCHDILKGYQIAIYSVDKGNAIHGKSGVGIAAELFTKNTGIPTYIIPPGSPHEKILSYHGQARLSIGLSISDAISTSLLEAMAMGSFPIQSWTSCANEWIKDGETGLLVPPEDPDVIEQAIRQALQNDQLVNQAAEKNLSLVKEKLNHKVLKKKIIDFYLTAAQN